jgi:hypothetical protein
MMKNAGWNEPQHELLAVDIHGMPGVVSPLVSGHDVEVWSEEVDDLAFAFIAPLRAENCEIHKLVVTDPRSNDCVVGSEKILPESSPRISPRVAGVKRKKIRFSIDNHDGPS